MVLGDPAGAAHRGSDVQDRPCVPLLSALQVVLAQLEGSGRGALAAYNEKAYTDLNTQLQEVPIKDGDEWLGLLMRRNSALGEPVGA